jgi:glycosyltransferase involved in cell wall biosynthesis
VEKSGAQVVNEKSLRVVGILLGDMAQQVSARVKYGKLFDALGCQFPLSSVYDARLQGLPRLLNAAQAFHPRMGQWKARFYQNVPAFRAQSSRATKVLERHRAEYDFVFQVGATFDAHWDDNFYAPSVIYTDYSAALAARRPALGRNPFTKEEQWVWNSLEAQALRRANHVFTRGEFVRQSLLEDYHLSPAKVTSVGGGVNFDALPTLPERHAQAPMVLFIGKDFHRKGGDLLWRACASLRAKFPTLRLVVVTDGPIPADLPREGVEVIAPTYDREFIANLYRQANVFALPSRLETWGDVLLEAMAYGLPCVGVSGEAMDEIIDTGKTGFVVPAGDVQALAGALGQLIGDQALWSEMSRAARQKVETTYTWERVVSRMTPIISGLFE